MADEEFEFTEELTETSETIFLGENNFSVDPSQIILDTSDRHKLTFNLIQWLAESPNRTIKSQRKQAVANTLGVSTRQVERLLKQYYEDTLSETVGIQRSDRGKYRVSEYWQEFIKATYEKSLKDKHPMSPASVVREVKRHAIVDLGLEQADYPHQATVYRILNPLIEQQKRKKRVRNPGSGSWLTVETRDGKQLKAEFSNQIIQCDHTELDIRIVDSNRVLLPERPWLTTVVDTFSSCVLGFHLWIKQPGSAEVAIALRHSILPKEYPHDYKLSKPWGYGLPFQYFFTDGGKDFRSKHLKAIGKKLGFQCELRDRPNQGGIVERIFKTINTQILKDLPGYTGSNVQERPKNAEKEACLTIQDLDKILASFFCDIYNHEPYPKDPRDTRFERWFKAMGGKLPEPLDERELDICLMKEAQRVVQAHGSIQFENLVYRGESLRAYKGEYVTLRYDPDHILTLYVYSCDTNDDLGDFLGYVHAVNMDTQELSLEELKSLNKERSKARREHSNYDALLALGKRKELVDECKQEKKARQQAEQKRLRSASKKNSKVVELRKSRVSVSSKKDNQLELLPERVLREELQPQKIEPQLEVANKAETQEQERHKLLLPGRKQNLKKIW
ncbi:Mu transposase C-terminal domain-containing protein [Nostoc sp. FACHB-152]|uniref:Mu transposase C-terminal domain-containing protein n=1 Tax=unclassified Nostoc TaxID=2593658 RepID=UPI001685E490|nr:MULTISPECIES: Mu transposase C-terminal domain-containing protein [unclassified Nostoc]MBD2452402.1 Mu transposase C-terminal domain-containing protein [Nostoc sp. FACHB-152]MBD2473299.1 Mu transposase C-terminal domain-containing protein [Nostoc sp. FACHB-145]